MWGPDGQQYALDDPIVDEIGLKRCTKCKHLKLLLAFFQRQSGPQKGRHASACRTCENESLRNAVNADPERVERRRQSVSAWQKEHPEWVRDRNLKRFNITGAEADALLAEQGGGCAICGEPPSRRALDIDHDHSCCDGNFSCGKCIRGLLCSDCNMGIGKLGDRDPERLLAAAGYLLMWKLRLHREAAAKVAEHLAAINDLLRDI